MTQYTSLGNFDGNEEFHFVVELMSEKCNDREMREAWCFSAEAAEENPRWAYEMAGPGLI